MHSCKAEMLPAAYHVLVEREAHGLYVTAREMCSFRAPHASTGAGQLLSY